MSFLTEHGKNPERQGKSLIPEPRQHPSPHARLTHSCSSYDSALAHKGCSAAFEPLQGRPALPRTRLLRHMPFSQSHGTSLPLYRAFSPSQRQTLCPAPRLPQQLAACPFPEREHRVVRAHRKASQNLHPDIIALDISALPCRAKK